MTLILTILRAAAGATIGAWMVVSMIGTEIEVMVNVPQLEATMARDPEYGHLTTRWYVESLPWLVVASGGMGAAIGARARFPSEGRP
jgi:hypothetical protein